MAPTSGSTGMTNNATAIQLDSRGIPVECIGGGHHFRDLPRQRRPIVTVPQHNIPMEDMRRLVAIKGLRRPTVNKYSGKRMRQSSHET